MQAISLMGPLMTPYAAVTHRPHQPVRHQPRYQPPMISGPSKKLSGFNAEAIPAGVALGAVGFGIMYLSSIAPSPLKQLLFGAGIFSVAWGILELFPKEAHANIAPARREAPPGEEVPDIPPGHLADKLELSFPRNQPNVGGRVRQLYADQEFEFSVSSHWSTPVTFFAGIAIFDNDSNLTKVWSSPPGEPPIAGGRKEIRVGPGETFPAKVMIPAMAPNYLWWPDAVVVELQLFRERDFGEPFMYSTPIPITFAWVG